MRGRPVAVGMPSPRDRLSEVPAAARRFAYLVILASTAGLVAAIALIGSDPIIAMVRSEQLYLAFGLIVIADLYPAVPWLRDVRGRVRLHFSGAFALALALVSGPATVILFPIISLIAQATMRTAPWRRVVNTAILTLEALAGFAVLYLVMDPWPAVPSAGQLVVAGALLAVIWEIVNVTLVCMALSLVSGQRLGPIVRIGIRRTLPWLAALVASPLIAYGLQQAPILIPSLALITVLIHHAFASTIRAADDARTDGLTGLANRTAALEALDERLQADSTAGATLMMVDLDDFKEVNDMHGHDAGDHVLAVTGARLRTAVPDDVLVARLGGDEFVLIGPQHDRADSLVGAITDAVGAPIPLPRVEGPPVTLRCSIGVASVGPGAKPLDLLRAADQHMYRAKGGKPAGSAP